MKKQEKCIADAINELLSFILEVKDFNKFPSILESHGIDKKYSPVFTFPEDPLITIFGADTNLEASSQYPSILTFLLTESIAG